MVATTPHVPEGAITLTLPGGGRRERHRELSVLGHSPQTVGVRLNIEVGQRRCLRAILRHRLSLGHGIVAVEEQQTKSGFREVN